MSETFTLEPNRPHLLYKQRIYLNFIVRADGTRKPLKMYWPAAANRPACHFCLGDAVKDDLALVFAFPGEAETRIVCAACYAKAKPITEPNPEKP